MKRNSVRGALPFVLTVAVLTLPISGIFDVSTIFLDKVPWYVGLAIVVGIVLIGALFDMLGVASAAARETPFHAMASKRVFGARRAIDIVRNAEKVSSICSDVIGDIAGVLSGAGSLAVSVQLSDALGAEGWYRELSVIGVTALTTSLTVGAKALGKTIAIHAPTSIILFAARMVDTLTLARSRGNRPRSKRKRTR